MLVYLVLKLVRAIVNVKRAKRGGGTAEQTANRVGPMHDIPIRAYIGLTT